MNRKASEIISGFIVFALLLQAVFIALKLPGVISWAWKWALAPLWISVSATAAFLAIAVLASIFAQMKGE